MTATARFLSAAALLAAALSGAAHDPIASPQEDDPVYVDEIKKDFLDKIERCWNASDWKGLFDLQSQASQAKNMHKLVRLPGMDARYVGLVEHLDRRFAALPPEALQHYRGQFDGAARRDYDRARAAGDREGLERVVETWFYSSRTDEALDTLANLHVEEGRLELAVHCWGRLLFHYPDSEIPRALTAARLASAAAATGNDSSLESVRRHVQDKGLGGDVIVGDGPMSLHSFLDGLRAELPPSGPGTVVREPSIAPPGGLVDARLTGVRPEIRRWSAEFAPAPEPAPQRRGAVVTTPDFPYLPAYGRVGEHEMVVYTNGLRVVVIDPARANEARKDEGIYFSYPPPGETVTKPQLPTDPRMGGSVAWHRPYIGVTVDGEHAFATLYSGKRPREAPAPGVWGMQDTLFGTTRLVCLNLRTQQVVWDTDFGEAGVAMRKLECWERNFAFAGPPLVRGDRVYAGVGTSPMGEEESRVICFDRRTGVVLWERFLASVTTGRPMWGGGGGTFTSRLTILEEDRGVLVAHSNLGAVAALDAVSGHVQWLSKYQRSNLGQNQGWGGVQVFTRPASPIVLHRGKMYALPQDAFDLLVVDLATGRIQKDPGKIETALDTPAWKDFHRLVGRMGDYLVFGSGRECCILNTATGKSHGLTVANTIGTGRGAIDGETLYLPCTDGGRGGLGMYYGQKMWRPFEQSILWWLLGEGGNITRAGNYLLYATGTKLFLYTDSEIVRAEYRRRLEQSPPNPAAWLDYGQLMRENQKWSEAARGYLSFIDAVAGDSEWMSRAREVRTELHGIFLKLGLESTARKAHADAAAHFGRARDFAWDGPTLTEATRLLAGACESAAEANSVQTERRAWARRAVEEYQELIRRSPPGFVKPGEAMVWHPIRRFALSRIAWLLKKHGADAYAGVARAAEQELRKAGKNPAALKALADLYPESDAALEALDLLAKQAESQGKWTAVAATLRDIRSRLGDRWTPARQKRLHDALEKCGDGERLDMELSRMEQLFEGTVKLGPEEKDPTVAEYLQKARAAAASVQRRPAEPPPGSTATLSTWEPAAAVVGPLDLAVGWDLVAPGGLEPPKWPADFEFFARGSTIELWNIRSKKRVWTAPHPGGWMGLAFTEPPNEGRGVRVTVVAPGSPAARAGLQDGDVIRSVDGVEVSESDFDLATEGRAAGARLSIVYERGGETRRTDVTTAAWPAASRPAIVGAVFTGEGAIAVAWEDCVAAFDSADGRPLWTRRPVRSRFVIRAVHAAADRVLAHEHHVPERSRSAFRFIGERGAKTPLAAEDQNSRVLGLDDSDGEPAWAVGFRFDPATATNHAVRFLGGPLDSHAGVVVSGYQNNLRTVEVVPISVADGREKEQGRIALTGTGGQPASAWTVDPTTGTLWVVDAMGRDQRKLRSFTRPDYARGPEITLEPHVDPMAVGFGLAAGADRIAVVSLSRHAAPPRVAVFSSRDGKVLASHRPGEGPLKDRLMPGLVSTAPELRLIGGLLTMEPDGMLILYNESKSAPGAGTTVRRASLTALSVSGGGLKIEWDAVTPTLITQAFADREVLSVRSGPRGFFVTTFRGIPPGKSDEATVLAFHGRKEEGAVRKMIDDLVITTDTNGLRRDPAPVRRGRVFLNRKSGLEILGD